MVGTLGKYKGVYVCIYTSPYIVYTSSQTCTLRVILLESDCNVLARIFFLIAGVRNEKLFHLCFYTFASTCITQDQGKQTTSGVPE